MTEFEPIDTESVRNTYVDRHGPDQEAYDEFDDWLRRFKEAVWDEVAYFLDHEFGDGAGNFVHNNNPHRKDTP